MIYLIGGSFVELLVRSGVFRLGPAVDDLGPLPVTFSASSAYFLLRGLSGLLEAFVGLEILDPLFDVFFGLGSDFSVLGLSQGIASDTERALGGEGS